MPDIARAIREGLGAWDRDDLDRLASLRGAEAASETSTTTAAEFGSPAPLRSSRTPASTGPSPANRKGIPTAASPQAKLLLRVPMLGLTGRLPRVSSHT